MKRKFWNWFTGKRTYGRWHKVVGLYVDPKTEAFRVDYEEAEAEERRDHETKES